ncbi:hypothetical protein D3C71_1277560 [compost metagenome]
MSQKVNIKITAKSIEQFQSAEKHIHAIDCPELVNRFDMAEYIMDVLCFYPNEYSSINKIDLPQTCKISSIEFTCKEIKDGDKTKMEYYVKMFLKVTPTKEGVHSFTAVMNFKTSVPNIEITNR